MAILLLSLLLSLQSEAAWLNDKKTNCEIQLWSCIVEEPTKKLTRHGQRLRRPFQVVSIWRPTRHDFQHPFPHLCYWSLCCISKSFAVIACWWEDWEGCAFLLPRTTIVRSSFLCYIVCSLVILLRVNLVFKMWTTLCEYFFAPSLFCHACFPWQTGI